MSVPLTVSQCYVLLSVSVVIFFYLNLIFVFVIFFKWSNFVYFQMEIKFNFYRYVILIFLLNISKNILHCIFV